MAQGHLGSRSLQRLLDAAMAINSDLALPVVLRRVTEVATELVGARYGALGVLDEDRTRLVQFVTTGVSSEQRFAIGAPPTGGGLLGWVIRQVQPLRLPDLHDHPDSIGFPPNHPPMTSFLGVPILIRGRAFGNLYMTDKRDGSEFTDVDEELALGLASAAATAIENARLFEAVHRREATLAAIQAVATALVGGVRRDEVLGLVVAHARQLVGADLATLALAGPGPPDMHLAVADGPLAEGLAGFRFPFAGSISGEVVRTGREVVIPDAAADARIDQPQVKLGTVGPAMWLVLPGEGAAIGSLNVSRRAGAAPFTGQEVELVRSFAAQAGVVMEYARAREGAERLSAMEDRERIAEELHDSVIQRLFATGMSLQGALPLITDPVAAGRVNEAIDSLDVTIRHIRSTIFGLSATSGSSAGLRAQMLAICREAGRALGFEPQVDFSGPVDGQVDPVVGAELLAVLREALSNVARHAHAHRVEVCLGVDAGEVVLSVVDDGVGLDPAAEGGGRGLRNLRSRAARLGGSAQARNRDGGSGTAIHWSAPLR